MLIPHVMFVVRLSLRGPCAVSGPDAIRDYMLRFLQQSSGFRVEATALQAVGDTILADVIQRGQGKSSGVG
jgi:hypothetical protein